MKKLLISISLLLVLVVAIVACNNNESEEPTSGSTTPQVTETPTEDETEPPTSKPEETTPPKDDEDPTTPPKDDEDPTTPPDDETEEPTTPPDPMEPTVVASVEEISGMVGTNGIESIAISEDESYVTITPEDGDPYGYLWNPGTVQPGARFVSIKYRSSTATNAYMQFYLASSGTGPQDDKSMLQAPILADGEWHILVIDTQPLIDAEIYDGEKISYFRFDPLEAGYKLDENGEKYYEDEANKTWARYDLPEGCSIDIEYVAFFQSKEAAELYEYGPTAGPITPEQIKESADNTGGQTFNQGLESATVTDNYITLTSSHNDPYVTVVTIGSNLTGDRFLAVKYRTTSEGSGEFFSGSGAGWAGPDALPVTYINDGEWHIATVDLSANTYITDNLINYCRYDFFTDATGGKSIDIQWIAFFPSVEAAEQYDAIMSDNSKSFQSDISGQTDGTDLKESDLKDMFEFGYGASEPHKVATNDNEELEYQFGGINEMYTSADGRYALILDINSMTGDAYAFVRGSRIVNSVDIPEPNNPNGAFMINNFYETDGNGKCGGSGIYAQIVDGKLNIIVKYFDENTPSRVNNKIYTVNVTGSTLTMADDGKNVSIIVDDKLAAVITLSGEIEYEDLTKVEPAIKFAQKAVITLADGTTETIENTLVASTCSTQVGIAVRSGTVKFSSIKVLPYREVSVPDTVLGSMTLDKETYAVGETVKITAKSRNDSGKDWIGIYAENAVPGGEEVTSISFIYTKDASEIVLDAEKYTAGTYKVYFFANDGYDNLIAGPVTITVTAAEETPDPETPEQGGEEGSSETGNEDEGSGSEAEA